MRPFIMLTDADSGLPKIMATDSIDVIEQLDRGCLVSFKTMQPEHHVLNDAADIWDRIHGSPERKH